MPEHTSFFSYLFAMFPDALRANMSNFGKTLMGQPVGAHQAEPIFAVAFVVLLVVGLAYMARKKITDYDRSVIPDANLSLRTLLEVLVSFLYGMMRDMMGAERAKKYFPVVGTAWFFILISNILGMIPGFLPPTSSLNVTAACAIVITVWFNYHGFKENGFGHIKHLFGPWLGPVGIPINILIFLIEALTMFVIRPVTLALRLMLNIAVDHLLTSILVAIFAVLLPIPIMVLGTLVAVVQPLVFCLLASIYIALATEHEDHGDAGKHDDSHDAKELGAKEHGARAHA